MSLLPVAAFFAFPLVFSFSFLCFLAWTLLTGSLQIISLCLSFASPFEQRRVVETVSYLGDCSGNEAKKKTKQKTKQKQTNEDVVH
jgi:hypothetical protein